MRFGTNRISAGRKAVMKHREGRFQRGPLPKSLFSSFWRDGFGVSVLFIPGLFLICVGLSALIAPHLVIAALSSLLMFVGGVFVFAAWKFIQWKKKLESVARSFEAHLVIQPGKIPDPDDDMSDPGSKPRKVMYH